MQNKLMKTINIQENIEIFNVKNIENFANRMDITENS